MKNIGYHTRLYSNNSTKVVGGSFGGALDMETVNRLVNTQFTVVVKNSGTAVFVDSEDREVRLYVSVDVDATDKGQDAMKQWQLNKYKKDEAERERSEAETEEIDELTRNLSHEEIVRRLNNKE